MRRRRVPRPAPGRWCGTAARQGQCRRAGGAPDLEEVCAGRQAGHREEVVDELLRVVRARPLVGGRRAVERRGQASTVLARCHRPSIPVRIPPPQPGPWSRDRGAGTARVPGRTARDATRPVLDGAPVRDVHRDQDGHWQVLCGTTLPTEDARIVHLAELVTGPSTPVSAAG